MPPSGEAGELFLRQLRGQFAPQASVNFSRQADTAIFGQCFFATVGDYLGASLS